MTSVLLPWKSPGPGLVEECCICLPVGEKTSTCWHTADTPTKEDNLVPVHSPEEVLFTLTVRGQRGRSPDKKIGAFLVLSIHNNKKEGLLETASFGVFFTTPGPQICNLVLFFCQFVDPSIQLQRQPDKQRQTTQTNIYIYTPVGLQHYQHYKIHMWTDRYKY